MFGMPDTRTGYAMKVNGLHLNRPDLHVIAAEVGVRNMDVVIKEGQLVVYNTSPECQEIVEDNALATFVALALNISPEAITDMTEVSAQSFKED